MNRILCLSILSIFASCGNTDTNTGDTSSDTVTLSDAHILKFKRIIEGIPVVKLPMELGVWPDSTPPITDSLTLLYANEFWDTHQHNIWGRVFRDQHNVFLLATQPDDLGTVFLYAMDPAGNFLTREPVQRGEFYSAPIDLNPHNHATLFPDMRFVEVDTMFKYPIDPETYEEMPGDSFYRITNMEYKIDPNGKFNEVKYDTTGWIKIE